MLSRSNGRLSILVVDITRNLHPRILFPFPRFLFFKKAVKVLAPVLELLKGSDIRRIDLS